MCSREIHVGCQDVEVLSSSATFIFLFYFLTLVVRINALGPALLTCGKQGHVLCRSFCPVESLMPVNFC